MSKLLYVTCPEDEFPNMVAEIWRVKKDSSDILISSIDISVGDMAELALEETDYVILKEKPFKQLLP